jgi:hypothetical protein
MRWTEIAAIPTKVTEIPAGSTGVSESCLRAWHLVAKVKDYLRRGVPADVLLEFIDEAEEPSWVRRNEPNATESP